MLSFYDIVGFSDHPANLSSADRLLGIGIIAAICLLAYFLLKKIVFPLVKRFTEKTEATWDDHLFNSRVLNLAAYLLPALLAYVFVPMLFSDHPMTVTVIDKAFLLLIVAISTRLVCAFISSFQIISSESELLRKRPLTGIYQTFKILVVCVGIILAISILLNREPSTILAGLGASAAVLMLVFKDSIMGLVAGIQINYYDILRPGDWMILVCRAVGNGLRQIEKLTYGEQQYHHKRRKGQQSEKHRFGDSSRQIHRYHRTFRLRQIVVGVRHALCRRTTALRGEHVVVCPAVSRPYAEA